MMLLYDCSDQCLLCSSRNTRAIRVIPRTLADSISTLSKPEFPVNLNSSQSIFDKLFFNIRIRSDTEMNEYTVDQSTKIE
jgi:hypothetical protein